jgi:hypothetical protein
MGIFGLNVAGGAHLALFSRYGTSWRNCQPLRFEGRMALNGPLPYCSFCLKIEEESRNFRRIRLGKIS